MDEQDANKPHTPQGGVPSELIDQLHKANEQFHHATKHLDQANGALVNPFEERSRAAKEIKDAESEVEKAEQEIGKSLKGGAAS